MSFPLLLTREELSILRVMLKTTITTRISEVAQSYRRTVAATLTSEPGDMEREDEIFVGRINTWMAHRINLELPLLEGFLRIPGEENATVIINLSKDGFETLQSIANLNFVTSDPDEDSKKLIDRISVVQPAIKAAFEVAEANEKVVAAKPTQPLADGRN